MSVCHVVPTTPPEFNGVGDYAFQLWKHWPGELPEWYVASSRIPSGAAESWPEARLCRFGLSREELRESLMATGAHTAVLHYVGYAYARRGAPTWMPAALEDWKSATGGRAVVVFHELYAMGKPWSSAFWLQPIQMRIARRLAALADRWVASCPMAIDLLRDKLRVDMSKGSMIPVGSNIELAHRPDWQRPWPAASGGRLSVVVFGSPETRSRALAEHRNLVKVLAEKGLIERLQICGSSDRSYGTEHGVDHLKAVLGNSVQVETLYDLHREDVSKLFLESHLGLMRNRYSILGKSGVNAAYCAHGVLPVIPVEPKTPSGPYVVNDDESPLDCASQLSVIGAAVVEALQIAGERQPWSEIAEVCCP